MRAWGCRIYVTCLSTKCLWSRRSYLQVIPQMSWPQLKMVVFLSHHRDVILSVASRFLGTRSRRTPRVVILPIPFAPFLPQALEPELSYWKRSQDHGQDEAPRGPSTTQLAKSARCSAQDDVSVEGLNKKIGDIYPGFGLHRCHP